MPPCRTILSVLWMPPSVKALNGEAVYRAKAFGMGFCLHQLQHRFYDSVFSAGCKCVSFSVFDFYRCKVIEQALRAFCGFVPRCYQGWWLLFGKPVPMGWRACLESWR